MSRKCELCGKHPHVGHNVSHAHNLTKRRWLPNLQRVRIVVDGTPQEDPRVRDVHQVGSPRQVQEGLTRARVWRTTGGLA